MILNQISKGLFRKIGEEWSLSGTVNSCLASTVSTKGVVLRKGNTGECNYTHSCFYQTVHSLVEVVIGDARKLDKCLCQFLLSPCASFKWFFTNEFKKHGGGIFGLTAVHQASHWQRTKSANCQLERHLLGPTWYATEKFQQYS